MGKMYVSSFSRMGEVEHNERGEMQFILQEVTLFPPFSVQVWVELQPCLSQWFSRHSSLVFWVLSRHAAALPTCPICICFLLKEKITVCIHFIVFVNYSGFQHCLTCAYSKAVYWHCLVAITPKETRINAVFLFLICRE